MLRAAPLGAKLRVCRNEAWAGRRAACASRRSGPCLPPASKNRNFARAASFPIHKARRSKRPPPGLIASRRNGPKTSLRWPGPGPGMGRENPVPCRQRPSLQNQLHSGPWGIAEPGAAENPGGLGILSHRKGRAQADPAGCPELREGLQRDPRSGCRPLSAGQDVRRAHQCLNMSNNRMSRAGYTEAQGPGIAGAAASAKQSPSAAINVAAAERESSARSPPARIPMLPATAPPLPA